MVDGAVKLPTPRPAAVTSGLPQEARTEGPIIMISGISLHPSFSSQPHMAFRWRARAMAGSGFTGVRRARWRTLRDAISLLGYRNGRDVRSSRNWSIRRVS